MCASILAEPDPVRDWVVLNPTQWGSVQFDTNRQTLIWKLIDTVGASLDIELVYSEYTASAIQRIEQLATIGVQTGNLLVARMRTTELGTVGEPISLIRKNPAPDENPVDAFFFDPAPESNLLSHWVSKFRFSGKQNQLTTGTTLTADRMRFKTLWNFKFWLRRQSERGVAEDRRAALQHELIALSSNLSACGFSLLEYPAGTDTPLAVWMIKANYICMQYERIMSDD